MKQKEKILIVGGGFAGAKAAKELALTSSNLCEIQLVDPKGHLEYHGAMYRMVTGRSPMEVCLPFADIFEDLGVETFRDCIVSVDIHANVAMGLSGSRYTFDRLILALGSVPAYFDIPGIEQSSFSLQSFCGSARLRNHFATLFADGGDQSAKSLEEMYRVIVVGAGATGVELAAELAWFLKDILKKKGLPQSLASVHLIESHPRILSTMPEAISLRVSRRLQKLGVTLHCQEKVERASGNCIEVSSEKFCAETIMWTAGVRAHPLLAGIEGLTLDSRGRVCVDESLRPVGLRHVYILGDDASTPGSGMAQTALRHGIFAARHIRSVLRQTREHVLKEPILVYSIPVGPRWAASSCHGVCFYGKLGWSIRRILDFFVFSSFIPLRKALQAFRSLSNTEQQLQSCPL